MSNRSARAQRRAAKQRNTRIAIVLILLVAILGGAYLIFGDSVFGNKSDPVGSGQVSNAEMITSASGLQYQDILVGSGAATKSGDTVSVHYTGTLADGSKFDSSLDRGTPFEFTIGAGRVIKGWEEGLLGMNVGGKRRLIIPPELGYGPAGYPPVIPQNATLYFDIELLAIK